MMSYAQIQEGSRRMARQSARLHQTPYIVEQQELDDWKALVASGRLPRLPFPAIGDRTPRGWKRLDDEMVDSSGFGSESEPATTITSFITKSLKPGFGYAIIEAGQFQVVIGRFQTPLSVKNAEGKVGA
jgi:hypothetical protein